MYAYMTTLYKGEWWCSSLAQSREAASDAIKEYWVHWCNSEFPQDQVYGAVSEEDQWPLAVDDGLIECVDHFSYLRSVIATENNLDAEIDVMIVNASKAFGALRNFCPCITMDDTEWSALGYRGSAYTGLLSKWQKFGIHIIQWCYKTATRGVDNEGVCIEGETHILIDSSCFCSSSIWPHMVRHGHTWSDKTI